MTKHTTSLTDPRNAAAIYAASFLYHYSFELNGYSVEELLTRWLDHYPADWVRLAVIEALYQGRYKAVSVEQILMFWQRRDKPTHRFNHEFERLISNKLPRNLSPSYKAEPLNYSSEDPPIEDSPIEDRSQQFLNTLKLLSTSTSPSEQPAVPIAEGQEHSDSATADDQPLSSHVALAESPEEPEPPQAIAADASPPSFQSNNYRKLVQLADFASAQRRPNELSTNAETESNLTLETVSEVVVSKAIAIASDSDPEPREMAIAEPEFPSEPHPEEEQNQLQVNAGLAPEEPNLALTPPSNSAVDRIDSTSMNPTQELCSSDSHASIHQFVPASKISEFHSKLKAVAQLPLEEALNQVLQPSSTLTENSTFTESE